MDWRDRGVIVRTKRLAEKGAITSVLTAQHGVWSAYWRPRRDAMLPVGSLVDVVWRARTLDHTGRWQLEEITAPPPFITTDPARLAALMAALALVVTHAPERDPNPPLFKAFLRFYRNLATATWWQAYGLWELAVLQAIGYGLDLTRCGLSGHTEGLTLISPKSGRAVSTLAGEVLAPYRHRLLPLPAYWLCADPDATPARLEDVLAGLRTTGQFLTKLDPKQTMPWERAHLIDLLTAHHPARHPPSSST